MKEEIKKNCDALRKSSKLETEEDFDQYLESIEYLKKHQSPEVLVEMFLSLSDVDAGEIQYELVEACEEYEEELYVSKFMELSTNIKRNSPFWGELMLCSILNTPSCARILINKFNSQGNDSLYCWIKDLAIKNPDYKKIIKRIEK
jgi:hypothetical protein